MSAFNSINWKKVRPINNYVVVALEQEDEIEGSHGVIITQLHKPKNHFRILRMPDNINYEISITDEIKHKVGVNDKILVNRLNKAVADRHLLDAKEQVYIIPFSMILAVWLDGARRLVPIGPNLLLKRIIHTELDLDTKIIKPAFTFEKDQSLSCRVVEFGCLKDGKEWFTPIKHNDLVHISKWDASHAEVNVCGEYHLIVHEKWLDYIENREMTLEYY